MAKTVQTSLFSVFATCFFLLTGCGCSESGYNDNGDNSNDELVQTTAVWAYPDSNTVTGSVNIGVVAYYSEGIDSVDFSLDNGPVTSITDETINPDTNEYEFVYTLNTTSVSDGEHKINAKVSGTELPELTIFVANDIVFDTWYVDSSAGSDDTGDGSSGNPWNTLGRALGTQWETQSLPHAQSGDTVLVRTGKYDLPDGQYGAFTKYVTVKPDGGSIVTIYGGGYLRSSFLKFEGINFAGGVTAYKHHIWIKDCYYEGLGKIWPDTINEDEAFRSRCVSSQDCDAHNVIVEGLTVHDANQGISLIGQGNYIIRNCLVYDQNGDAMKFQGENVLITGNTVHHVIPPPAWSVSKNAGPYDCLSGVALSIHLSEDYGNTFPIEISVNLTGASQSGSQIADQFKANKDFVDGGFFADVSESPYPYIGNVRIVHIAGNERNRFYIDGDDSNIFSFSDNTRSLNNISESTPAMHTTDHCDYIANDAGDCRNIIIRNNIMYGGESQGIKIDAIGSSEKIDYYKENIVIVNNLIAGNELSPRLIYMNHEGSGSPRSILHYINIMIMHNTIYKPTTGTVRTQLTLDLDNPYITNMVIKNNIVGDYFTGDWPLDETGGMMDYNLFTDNTYSAGYDMNEHSLLGDPDFNNVDLADNWDFSLGQNSEATGRADPLIGIKYDIDWNIRNPETLSIGCYEGM
ncbi:MAG: hypothetical protein SVR08_10070 [Spirochaetota bacterium]|nr:hypothetical protein [Spirochaetota bacterium]